MGQSRYRVYPHADLSARPLAQNRTLLSSTEILLAMNTTSTLDLTLAAQADRVSMPRFVQVSNELAVSDNFLVFKV